MREDVSTQLLRHIRERKKRRRQKVWGLAAGILALGLMLMLVQTCEEDALEPKVAMQEKAASSRSAEPTLPPIDETKRKGLFLHERDIGYDTERLRGEVRKRLVNSSSCFSANESKRGIRWNFRLHSPRGKTSDHEFLDYRTHEAILGPTRNCLMELLAQESYKSAITSKKADSYNLTMIIF